MSVSLSLPPARGSLGSPGMSETSRDPPPLLKACATTPGLAVSLAYGVLFVFVVGCWNCMFVLGLLFVLQCVC